MSRFAHFGATPFGQRLAAAIDTPERYIELRAFSREGFPAVTALVSVLTPNLESLRQTNLTEFNAAKQFVGWFTGEIMRHHGHYIVRRAASVPGTLFSVAAVWSSEPSATTNEPDEDGAAT